jgi:hypothetical protein
MNYDLLAAVLALALTPTAGCGSPSGPADALGETVSLHVGQSASLLDRVLQLRFDDVASDSRCPSDVQCVRAGEAEVKVTAVSHGRSEAFSLFVGAAPSSVEYADFTIELRSLDPYPKQTHPTAREEYVATFRVTPRH